MLVSVLSICFLLHSQNKLPELGVNDAPPKLLVDAFKQRMEFKTAKFTVRFERDWPGQAKETRNIEIEWTGDSLLYTNNGNDEGIRNTDPNTGQAPLGVRGMCMPEIRILNFNDGTLWTHAVASPMLSQMPANQWFDYVDVRTYGLRGIEIQNKTPLESISLQRGSYEVEKLNKDVSRVRYRGNKSERGTYHEFEWDIYLDKGPAISGVREYYNDEHGKRNLASDTSNDLDLVDGVWWPSRVHARIPISGIEYSVEFRQVEFNRPEHRKIIDVDVLNVPTGVMVTLPNQSQSSYYLAGGQVMDQETWRATQRSFDTAPLRQWMEMKRALGKGEFPSWWLESNGNFGLSGVEGRPDLWESFVRRWVLKHTNNHSWVVVEPLTPEQRTAAKGILDDCQKKAMPLRARLDSELKKVMTEIEVIELKSITNLSRTPTTRPSGEIDKRIVALRERKRLLEKSVEIERVFEELKSRLDGLLTSAQRNPSNATHRRPKPPSLPPNVRATP